MNWFFAGLLGLLGFVGCGKDEPKDEYGVPYDEYGAPWEEYVAPETPTDSNNIQFQEKPNHK